MWRFSGSGNSTIEPVSDGVELTNKGGGEAFLSQFAQFETEIGSYYAFATKIRAIGTVQNVVARITFEDSTKKEVALKSGLNSLIFKADKKIKSYEIRSGASSNNFVVNYIDLFKGNIVYEHQKENYDEAIFRCFNRVVVFENGSNAIGVGFAYTTSNTEAVAVINLPAQMSGTPNVLRVGNWSLKGLAGVTKVKKVQFSNNVIYLTVEMSNSEANKLTILTVNENSQMIITREPL